MSAGEFKCDMAEESCCEFAVAKVLSVLSEGDEVCVEKRWSWILLFSGESRFTLALIVSGDDECRDLYPSLLEELGEEGTVFLEGWRVEFARERKGSSERLDSSCIWAAESVWSMSTSLSVWLLICRCLSIPAEPYRCETISQTRKPLYGSSERAMSRRGWKWMEVVGDVQFKLSAVVAREPNQRQRGTSRN